MSEQDAVTGDQDLETGLRDALASQSELANAPALQDQSGDDSITTEQVSQTPIEPWYAKAGFKDVDNEDAALERVQRMTAAGQQAYQQAQYYAQQNQQLQTQLQAIQQAQQAVQPRVEAKPAPAKKPWDAVPYDDSYLEWIDPATKTWRENTPHNVVVNAQKFSRGQQEFINKMYTQPDEVLAPYITEHARGLVSPLEEKLAAIEVQLDQQRQQREIASLLGPYQNQLFVMDANGRVQKDQFGQPLMTPGGQNFAQYTNIAEQMGLTDPRHQAAFALLAAKVAQLESQQQAPVPATVPQRQQHEQAIYANGKNKTNGATRQPNRGNTINASQGVNAPLQNDRFSAEDLFRQGLREQFPNGIPIG